MAETNITEIGIKVKYETEGLEQASSQTESFVDAAEEATGTLEELGDAAEEAEEKVEGLTAIEIESARATLDNSSKVRLLVDKLRILSKQYASVSKQEGDHSKQLNSIALQYLNTQKSLDKLAFSPEGGNPEIPFTNMGDEGLKAASRIELLQRKLEQISNEMRKASMSTKDESKKLVSLALQYNNTAAQIEKLKEATEDSTTPYKNMSSEAVTTASKIELLQMKLQDLKRQIDECSMSSEDQTQKMISLGLQYNSTAAQIKKLQEEAAKTVDSENASAYQNFSTEMLLSASKADLLKIKLDELKRQLDECSMSTENQTQKMVGIAMQYNSTKEQLEKFKQEQENVGKETEKTTSKFSKFLGQLKRIAVYRLIRTALKEITQGFREGVENLYQWSRLNDTTFAASMDSLAISTLYVKNVLGTALAPVIQDIVVPAIYAISEAVADAVNWMNQLIAILKGESTYTKAIRKQTEYAKATGGAAKELKRMLLGFDEINRLEDNSGGGGGSATDYGGMFETATVNDALANSLDSLRLTVRDVLFDWSNLNGEQICEKIITGLGLLAGGVAGFMIGGVPGAIVGSLAGLGFTLIANSLIFDHDGKLDKNEVLFMLTGTLGALVGGVIGFTIGGPAGALIGATLGFGIFASVSSMLFKKQEGANVDVKTTGICTVLGALLGAVIGFAFGGPGGALIGATVGTGIVLLVSKLLMDNSIEYSQEIVGGIVVTALMGLVGGVIGLVVGGPGGALIGATIGTGVALGIVAMVWKQTTGQQSKQTLFNLLSPVLTGILGAAVLGSFLGPVGTLIGFTLGVALTLSVQSVTWSNVAEKINNSALNNFGKGSSVNINDHGNNGPAVFPKSSAAVAKDAADKYQEDGKKRTDNIATTYANGGYVDAGTVFIAGEAGAEFVGNINGKTGVMNTDQFGDVMRPTTEAIYAIGNAIVSAVSANKDVYIDGKNVTDIVRTNSSRINRAYGV